MRGADYSHVPGQEPWGAQLHLKELRPLLRDTFADPEAFALVTAAQTAFAAKLLDAGASVLSTSHDQKGLLANLQRLGAGFGAITDAAGLAKIAEGKDLDEAQTRNVKIFNAVLNSALAVPQKAAWPVAAGVVGAWTGLLEEALKGDAESRARSEANDAVEKAEDFVRDLTVRSMLEYELFGKADPPAETHPWATLEGLEKGDDPRDNPNNFLKDDGRTLMTMDEMLDNSPGASGDRDRRVEAYKRWLYEQSGLQWRELKNSLDDGFSRAFSKFES